MPFKYSVFDRISGALSPAIRKLKDVNTKLLGTRTNVIRIKQVDINLLGDKSYEYQTNVIDNVIIQYPFNQVEVFGNKDTTRADSNTIDFYDLLPINMYTYYDKAYSSGASQIDENDLIVDVLWDNNGVGIPIVHQVSRIYSSFYGKYSISKKYELNLRRGYLEPEIESIINTYISQQQTTSGQAI